MKSTGIFLRFVLHCTATTASARSIPRSASNEPWITHWPDHFANQVEAKTVLKWIFAKLGKVPIKANIYLQIFAYYSKYSLCIASIFTSLRPQLIFGSFWKYSLHFASNFLLWSEIKKIFDKKRIFTSIFIRFACKSAYFLHIRLYPLQTKYFGTP